VIDAKTAESSIMARAELRKIVNVTASERFDNLCFDIEIADKDCDTATDFIESFPDPLVWEMR